MAASRGARCGLIAASVLLFSILADGLVPLTMTPPRMGSSSTLSAKDGDDAPGSDASVDRTCKTLQCIEDQLLKMKANLLTSSSSTDELESDQPSDEDKITRDPSTGLTVRETLLSTRLLDLDLNKTRIDKSTLVGAGRGLFATEHIAKGEVITCYPGDALLCGIPFSSGDADGYETEESLDFEDEEWVEETVLWGSHVSEADRLEEDDVFDGIEGIDGSETVPPLTDYALVVGETYSVMGMPSLDTDPAYYGHFANDGAGHFATKKADDGSAEGGIAAYVLESVKVSNAKHHSVLDGLHMATYATKAIEEGEEIFVTYGPDYWMQHSTCMS